MFGKKKEEGMFQETPALRAAAQAFYAMTQEKDWSKAAAVYHEAYQLVGSSTVPKLALTGEVCMWYGFALKNLCDLEAISEHNPPTKAQLTAVMQIKALWTKMLEIYSSRRIHTTPTGWTLASWSRFAHTGLCGSRS